MTAKNINQFGGMLPAWSDNLLPEGQAANSENGYLFSGDLMGWRQPKLLRTLTNSAAKFAYRVPTITSSKAVAYLVFVLNPSEGDTLSVGEDSYTFTATVTNSYDVLIGASANESAANLLDAITYDEGAGTNEGTKYGTGTVANPYVSQTAGDCSVDYHNFGSGSLSYVKVIAPDYGAAYNSTYVAESTSGVRLLWLYDLGATSHTTATLAGGTNETFDSDITGAATWLEFVDPDTHVMRSQVADDTYDRYYFASPSQEPKYNTRARIEAGSDAWLLGVPNPGCAPTVAVSGGGDSAQLGNYYATDQNNATAVSNTMYLIPVTPDGAMQLDDVAIMPNNTTDTSIEFFAVLFDDNAGQPGVLLNIGAPTMGITAGTEAVSSFQNPSGLLSGVQYWIGIIANADIDLQTIDGNNNMYSATWTYTNGPPSYSPTVTANAASFMIWGDLTTSSVLEARSYVYTWVTEYGEEGPPSPASEDENGNPVTGWSNGKWTVSLWSPPDDDVGVLRNIKKLRLYRTISGTSGSTVFYQVAELDVGTATYDDVIEDSVVALNNQMPSTNWFPPPEGLQDIQAMPNGIAVGFKGNELWFSEPYRPHAWPPGYVMTTEFPIVGIGISGQSVVAATSGTPYVATGVNPSTMTLDKIEMPEPCISRGSVVGTSGGVYYMSPNGLILVQTAGQADNTTETWITREKWRSLVPQKNTRAVKLLSAYFCFGTVSGTDTSVAQQGFTIELKPDSQNFSIWPQPGGHRVGFNKLTSPNDYDINNLMLDPWTGTPLLIQNGGIYYYDFTDTAPTMVPYTWKSGVFQAHDKKNFAAMKIYFTVPDGTPAQNATRNTDAFTAASWDTLDTGQYGIVRVYADKTLVMAREIRTSGELLRLPDGFKADYWQIEVTGRVVIDGIQIATSIKELRSV